MMESRVVTRHSIPEALESYSVFIHSWRMSGRDQRVSDGGVCILVTTRPEARGRHALPNYVVSFLPSVRWRCVCSCHDAGVVRQVRCSGRTMSASISAVSDGARCILVTTWIMALLEIEGGRFGPLGERCRWISRPCPMSRGVFSSPHPLTPRNGLHWPRERCPDECRFLGETMTSRLP